MIGRYLASIALLLSTAAQAYTVIGVGQAHYALNNTWSGMGDGYEVRSRDNPLTLSFGVGKDYGWYSLEARAHYFGRMELDALWGNPDDRQCPTCLETSVGIQSGEVYGISGAFLPRWRFHGGDVHAGFGALFYRAEWRGSIFTPQHKHARGFAMNVNLHDTGVSPMLQIGFTFGKFTLDFTRFSSVAVDGEKYRSLGGGGAYERIDSFTLSYRF